MPTLDHRAAISLDEAHERAGQLGFATRTGGPTLGAIGLEPEYFAINLGDSGRAHGRLPLVGPEGVLVTLDRLVVEGSRILAREGEVHGPWEYPLGGGGRLTFEPGGQIEHSTAPWESVAHALADVHEISRSIDKALRAQGAVLAAVGADLWHCVDEVPLQLRSGRYTAMTRYYNRRNRWGRFMMRHTASLQLNLDLGPEGMWQERWLAANLIAPVVAATFASSPGPEGVSTRARAWQELDPSRTGFPGRLLGSSPGTPQEQWADAALAADVMMVRLDRSTVPGSPGWSFGSWIEDGHPLYGWPQAQDLEYHLTTLFFEVRPRGFLELRSPEALPERWRAAPVVLISSLLYDDRGREEAVALIEGHRTGLDGLWRRAAISGVRDPEIGSLSSRLWQIALDAAERLPRDYLGAEALDVARRFVDRYPARHRMPADDLARLLDHDPAEALAWAGCGTWENDLPDDVLGNPV